MDEIDIPVCRLLSMDTRMPCRDLADKLGISVSAVHARLKTLTDEGHSEGLVRPCLRRAAGRRDGHDLRQAGAHLQQGS